MSFSDKTLVIVKSITFVCSLLILTCCKSQERSYNFSFEKLDSTSKPIGWTLYYGSQNDGFISQIDSSNSEQGKYSLNISKVVQSTGSFGVCTYKIPASFSGDKITLTGCLKTENVTGGYAGLWLRIDGENHRMLAFDNMHSRGVQGTTGWKEYSIQLLYNDKEAKQIVLGALLSAHTGKVWADNFHLFIDGKPIDSIVQKKLLVTSKDTFFSKSSGISFINLDEKKIRLLTNLGMIWGFLKYYHPAIIQGKYNWDAELFKELPEILKAPDNQGAYKVIENWIDGLGKIPTYENCATIPADKIKLKADYGYLFMPNNLPITLIKKLQFIRDNYKSVSTQYYVEYAKTGNPLFSNEIPYSTTLYPNVELRLLCLYRYWNIIQYFFPYRHLIGEDWNKILSEFIPKFINAKNAEEYTLTCLEIIARIHDSHANIVGSNPILDSLKGLRMSPIQAKFIQNKLIVTNYYDTSLAIKEKIHIGDIVEKIDGVLVDSLVKKYLPLTPASNYTTQLRDLPTCFGFLLRSNNANIHLQIKRETKESQITLSTIPLQGINANMDFYDVTKTSGYKILDNNIGYIYPGKLKENDLATIEKVFANTKGIIIDMRCYLSIAMPFTYGAWLKDTISPFVYLTKINLRRPGTIALDDTIWNGKFFEGKESLVHYKDKVVIIVNSSTQSAAEYITMALSTIPNATVIGSTTAGADGDVSDFTLPGGISTRISGIGIYYPDGTNAQRKGVKIDIHVKPTIEGIREGKDELLNKASSLIL